MSCVLRRRFPGSTGHLTPSRETGYVFKLAQTDEWVAAATEDRCIRLIDLATLGLVNQICPAHDSTITDLQAVPTTVSGASSGSVFLSSSADGTVKVWDIRANTSPAMTLKLSNNSTDAPMFAAAVSGSGTCAAACDSSISLFKFGEWKRLFEYTEAHFQAVTCMGFEGEVLVSGGEDGLVNLLNTADLVNEDNGQCPALTMNTDNCIRSCHFWGNRLFAFSTTESVSSWDLSCGVQIGATNDSIRMHPMLAGVESFGYLIGMNSDCTRILCGNSSGDLLELNSLDMSVTSIFDKHHSGVVRSAVYVPNSNLIVSAGEDGFVLEWERAGGQIELSARTPSKPKTSLSTRPY